MSSACTQSVRVQLRLRTSNYDISRTEVAIRASRCLLERKLSGPVLIFAFGRPEEGQAKSGLEGGREAAPLFTQTVGFGPSAEAAVWGHRPTTCDIYTIRNNVSIFY